MATKLVMGCEGFKYVVFLEEEVMEVALDRAFVKQKKKELKSELKSKGVGALKRSFKGDEFWETYGDIFYDMSAEEIVSMHKEITRVPYSEISLLTYTGLDQTGSFYQGAADVKTGSLFVDSKKESIIVDHRHSKTSEVYQTMVEIFREYGLESDS